MTAFPTITGSDWLAAKHRALNEPNLAWRQIRERLFMDAIDRLIGAVETARHDAESAIAEAEESHLRVPNEFLKERVAMYSGALAAYRNVFSVENKTPADQGGCSSNNNLGRQP
jgi:hypothetical protein